MRKLAQGFTLIELLVVISIIGLLATLVMANLNSARSRARDAQRKSDIKSISTAIKLYQNDQTSGDAPATSDDIPWTAQWKNSTTGDVYMNVVPQDPLSGQIYYYKRTPGQTDSYVLSACLENGSDTGPSTASVTAANFGNNTCSSGRVFTVSP